MSHLVEVYALSLDGITLIDQIPFSKWCTWISEDKKTYVVKSGKTAGVYSESEITAVVGE